MHFRVFANRQKSAANLPAGITPIIHVGGPTENLCIKLGERGGLCTSNQNGIKVQLGCCLLVCHTDFSLLRPKLAYSAQSKTIAQAVSSYHKFRSFVLFRSVFPHRILPAILKMRV